MNDHNLARSGDAHFLVWTVYTFDSCELTTIRTYFFSNKGK